MLVRPHSPQIYLDFLTHACLDGKKALFTVGGWDGGIYFSDLVASAPNRTAFAIQLKQFADKYEFDGVDIGELRGGDARPQPVRY